MAEVEDINEIDLLNNIRNRYFQNKIFTSVGSTLIVINPFQKIQGSFGEEVLDEYIEVNYRSCILFTIMIYLFFISNLPILVL